MAQVDAPRDIGPTGDFEQDTVITSKFGAITLTIPARSGGGWIITYCRRDYSDDCITGSFPDLEFKLPREDGGFDVFPFDALGRLFGEPYSIGPGPGRKVWNVVSDGRGRLAVMLAALIAGISGILCNPGDDDKDVDDTEPPVTDTVESDVIG